MLGRDPGAGVCAGAGHLLGRHRRDPRHGLGTAITVAIIATLTVTATGLAARFAATRTGYGTLALRGIEVAAAAFVLLFGVALLAGYMVNERMVGIA